MVWTKNEFCYLYYSYYLFISILLLEKKNVIQIWNFMMNKIELSWSQTIQIYFFFFIIDLNWAFDHVFYKLLYGCHSLDCRNVALNMFAMMFFCLIINFNVIFLLWSLFYSKRVIHFCQREIYFVLVILYAELNFIFIFVMFVNSLVDVSDQAS